MASPHLQAPLPGGGTDHGTEGLRCLLQKDRLPGLLLIVTSHRDETIPCATTKDVTWGNLINTSAFPETPRGMRLRLTIVWGPASTPAPQANGKQKF